MDLHVVQGNCLGISPTSCNNLAISASPARMILSTGEILAAGAHVPSGEYGCLFLSFCCAFLHLCAHLHLTKGEIVNAVMQHSHSSMLCRLKHRRWCSLPHFCSLDSATNTGIQDRVVCLLEVGQGLDVLNHTPTRKKSKKDSSTRTSQLVTHASTIQACWCLTSQIRRDEVYSPEYGRIQYWVRFENLWRAFYFWACFCFGCENRFVGQQV